jgi:ribosome biogenesis GTPase
MQVTTETGLIVRAQSGFFTVQTAVGLVTCQLRGRLKQGKALGDIAAIGDRVTISQMTPETGMIEAIEERQHALIRLDPRPRGVYQQVILANLDQVIFVFACAQPTPRLRMLDRFLVIAEKQHIPAVIVANKIDLVEKKMAEDLFGHYPKLGYPNLGVEDLRQLLTGKISALAGPSGVGKSSLLNAVQTGLGLVVREISGYMKKGQHTTNFRQLIPLEAGGYVGDTPGLKSLALWDTEPEELDGYFPEIASLVSQCKFNDCTHKPTAIGCAVRKAVETGQVHPERYESYVRLRAGEE